MLLDEPTSGLDPIIRREFLQTVIGAYMESAPGQRTVLVSTHLIGEWEGMIDEFTIVEKGRALITMQTDDARERCRRIYVRWAGEPQAIPAEIGKVERTTGARAPLPAANQLANIITTSYSAETESRLRALGAERVEIEPLSLEDIFVAISGTRAESESDQTATAGSRP